MIENLPDEEKVISLSLKKIALTGTQFEKITLYCLLASGIIAGTIFSSIETLLKIVSISSIKICFTFILFSVLLGCTSFYLSLLRKQQIDLTSNFIKEIEEITSNPKTLDFRYIIDKTYEDFPWFIKLLYSRIVKKKLQKKTPRVYQHAANLSCYQISACIVQVAFLAMSFFPIILSDNPTIIYTATI